METTDTKDPYDDSDLALLLSPILIDEPKAPKAEGPKDPGPAAPHAPDRAETAAVPSPAAAPKRGRGRPKGSTKKPSAEAVAAVEAELQPGDVKGLVSAVFELSGGIAAMVAWAQKYPKDFYAMYLKLGAPQLSREGRRKAEPSPMAPGIAIRDFTGGGEDG